MDREHEELVDQANEFSAAADRGASRAELELRLTQLIEGFQRHFDGEESFMKSTGFPGMEAHTEEHQALLSQIRILRDELDSGAIALCQAIPEFVRVWVAGHLEDSDIGFANYLRAREAARDSRCSSAGA
jgi:hemerythrin-like metal-binding protein